MYAASPQLIARAVAVAAVVALVFGIAWGLFPLWSFWFAIASGFAIAEGTVRFTGAKRGSVYQTIGMLGVLACALICRLVLARQYGYDWARIGQTLASGRLDTSQGGQRLYENLQLNLENLIYLGLAMAIPYIRFR